MVSVSVFGFGQGGKGEGGRAGGGLCARTHAPHAGVPLLLVRSACLTCCPGEPRGAHTHTAVRKEAGVCGRERGVIRKRDWFLLRVKKTFFLTHSPTALRSARQHTSHPPTNQPNTMARLLLALLALLAVSAAAAPSLERLVEVAATAPYGDPEGDAARAQLADNSLAYSAKRWDGGVPPAVTEAGPHATVQHAAPGEVPAVPARGVDGPDAEGTDTELEGMTESDVGAPDGECGREGVGGEEGGGTHAPCARGVWSRATRHTLRRQPFSLAGWRDRLRWHASRRVLGGETRVQQQAQATVSSRPHFGARARAPSEAAKAYPTTHHPVPPPHTTPQATTTATSWASPSSSTRLSGRASCPTQTASAGATTPTWGTKPPTAPTRRAACTTRATT